MATPAGRTLRRALELSVALAAGRTLEAEALEADLEEALRIVQDERAKREAEAYEERSR